MGAQWRRAVWVFALILTAPVLAGADDLQSDDFQSMDAILSALSPLDSVANYDGIHQSIDLNIQFALGSAELLPAAERQIEALAEALGSPRLAAYRIRLVGHTDTRGADDLNESLSAARAHAVAERLVGDYGVALERLQPVGMGSRQLLEGISGNDPRQRRVEIIAEPLAAAEPSANAASPEGDEGEEQPIEW